MTTTYVSQARDGILTWLDSVRCTNEDPLETETDHVGEHTWEQIWGQRNGAALNALALLGVARDAPRARSQFADLTKVDGAEWTLSLDWRNPWRFGESWSRAIRAFLATLPESERNDRGRPHG